MPGMANSPVVSIMEIEQVADHVATMPGDAFALSNYQILAVEESVVETEDIQNVDITKEAIPSGQAQKLTEELEEKSDLSDIDSDSSQTSIPKDKRISDRRRRLNAIAKAHIAEAVQADIKNGIAEVNSDQQSTRWLVNQSQAKPIIASPRDYQVELFERAKQKNIIAVLDTGSGKTLIAVLLIRHMMEQELEDRSAGLSPRMCFFLVDSVPLAYQQYAVLKTNLDYSVEMICGEMGSDTWSAAIWEEHFQKHRIIVCTADILYFCLSRSLVTIGRINLLVFDEAHHAKKQHVYAMIIKDFYAREPSTTRRPKIFGMTASPVDSKTDVKTAALQLEGLLHCQIATVVEGSFQTTNKTANEEIHEYQTLTPKKDTLLYSGMLRRFQSNQVFKKSLTYAHEATRELGSWCSDQVWPLCFSDDEVKGLLAKTESKHYSNKVLDSMEVLEKRQALINEAHIMIKNYEFEKPDFKPGRPSSRNLSSKVLCLIQILRERFQEPTSDKCIVFVRQRYTARLLEILLGREDIRTPYLKVAMIVGSNAGQAGNTGFTFRAQALSLDQFRNGVVNCLIATSVAEEGLDIPDCNLVVRFDLYHTVIQYIQSRGRARHANSKYIHMIEAHNHEHRQLFQQVRRNETIMRQFCSQLPQDRLLTGNDYNIDYFLAKDKTQSYTIPETGAKLTYRTSLVVLANFVSSLSNGAVSAPPDYIVTPHGRLFICEVILPRAVDDNENDPPIRGTLGRPASTKQVAKCSAAFEMCKLLRKGKYIDGYLMPKYTNRLPAMRNAQLSVNSKKREEYTMRTKPLIWSIEMNREKLFVTIFSLESAKDEAQPIAILTKAPLPTLKPIILYFAAASKSAAVATKLDQCLSLTKEQIHQVMLFTMCVFDDVFNKKYETDVASMPYLFLPIQTGAKLDATVEPIAIIDWNTLQAVERAASVTGKGLKVWQDKDEDFFHHQFIVDPFDGARRFWSRGIDPSYKPLDPLPPGHPAMRKNRNDQSNILEYSCSLFRNSRKKMSFDETQPVIKAELVSLRRNMLDEHGMDDDSGPKQCLLVLEPLKISPLPVPLVIMAYTLPSLIHRVESILIAGEAFTMLDIHVGPELALEAFTKDSDNTGEHDEEQIDFQRGMGNNYERLELLGDSFLKMATTVALFGLHPDSDEYSYHVDRMVMICNKNLRDNALKVKLYEFIRSRAFNRRSWYPEGLVQTRGKITKVVKSHPLGDKTIADVCEAIIGASYLQGQRAGNMDQAVDAVTKLVCSDHHPVKSWAGYYELYQLPAYQTAPATQAHLQLARSVECQHAYKFHHPRLLRSAFTHPSYPYTYEYIPNYQRLEFLGDALLDMACVDHLFHRYPHRDPQWLTEHKMAMVSNQFLGALCVALGFHRHLQVFHQQLQSQVTEYVQDIVAARSQAELDAKHAGLEPIDCAPDYWLTVKQPPKCLPDMLEAYIGAIFLDSSYDYAQVQRFFDTHVRWFFRDMSIYDTFANKHPTTFLTNHLQASLGCVDWDVSSHEVPGLDARKPRVAATVIVHDAVVASAQAESSRCAKIAAAKKALTILEGLSLHEYRRRYSCDCKGGEARESDHGTAC